MAFIWMCFSIEIKMSPQTSEKLPENKASSVCKHSFGTYVAYFVEERRYLVVDVFYNGNNYLFFFSTGQGRVPYVSVCYMMSNPYTCMHQKYFTCFVFLRNVNENGNLFLLEERLA